MRKNDAFDAKIVNTRLTKIFIAIFAPDERLPSSATLGATLIMFKTLCNFESSEKLLKFYANLSTNCRQKIAANSLN